MAFQAGQIEALLRGRFDPTGFARFDTAMKRSGRNMGVFERDVDRSSRRSSAMLHAVGTAARTGAAVGIVGLGAALVGSVKKAADFESQMSSLQSVTRANGREMGLLKKQALAAGAATKFSALEAAEAQTELAKGGLSVAQIMKGGLKAALGLAAAGELDLGQAAETTANAMNLFGIRGGKAVHVADALATAANATTADVSHFAQALTQGGSAAKAAGLSFDETVAFLEALANAGIRGSDAGTSMKAALTQLASPTAKASALMDELGINVFDAHGNMKPLADVAGIFQDKLGGLTREQRLQAATTLVGTDGMRALLSLYDAGPEAVATWERALGKQGTAAEVAAKKQDNLKGKIENLKGSLETAAIILGTALIPSLTRGAEKVTDFINRAAASGDLQDFGRDLASGLEDAARVGVDVGAGIINIGQAAGTVLGPVGTLVDLLGGMENVLPMLAGAAAGLFAFRAAAAVAPGVAALATAVGDVFLAFRAGGAGFAASTLLTMVNPVGLVMAAFVALGAVLALTLSQEDAMSAAHGRAADAARDAAAAQREYADAVQALTDAEFGAADSAFSVKHAEDQEKQTRAELNKLTKDGKQGTAEYKQKKDELKEASFRTEQSERRYANSLRDVRDKQRGVIDSAQKREQKAKTEIQRLLELRATEVLHGKVSEETSRKIDAALTKEYRARQQIASASRRAALADLNLQRLQQGLAPIAEKNQRAVSNLGAAYNKLPKKVQTRLAAEDQDALATLGRLSGKLGQFGRERTVRRILANSSSAEQAISRLRGLLASLRDKTVNVTTIFRSIGGHSGQGAIYRAAGRGPGGAEAAVVGEGAGAEWAVDPDTGRAVRVDRPTLMGLRDRDYVIPTEPRYRGRAWELMAAMARDMGVQAFQKGKHGKGKGKGGGKHRFVPNPRQFYRLSADDLEQVRDSARQKWQDAVSRVKSLEGDPKQKSKLPGARKQAQNLKRAYEKQKAIAAKARVYADRINKQEDLVEIARQQMDLADKQDNQKAYNKALKKRRGALGNLEALLMTAIRFSPDGSKFQREMRKQILGVRNDAQDLIGAEGDFGAGAEPEMLTPDEQARLERLEADVALAGLTEPTDDDKAALGALLAFREAVLGRVQGTGNLPFITQAAEDVKSARDALTSLTGTTSQDQDIQAQLDQANARTAAALEDARLSRAWVQSQTPFAVGAGNQGPVLEQHFHSPIPATADQVAQIAAAAVAGIDGQGNRISPRKVVEV